MSGGRPFDAAKFRELILYLGQTPLRADRTALAAILFNCDMASFARYGRSITGQRYLAAAVPGKVYAPRNPLAAFRLGLRWGAVRHRLKCGTLRRSDATWIADQWRNGVPF